MVARRRLKRPPRRSAHLAKHRTHVSLAEAGIDRVAAKVDEEVKVMRDEMQREDMKRREGHATAAAAVGHSGGRLELEDGDAEDNADEDAEGDEGEANGGKVAG